MSLAIPLLLSLFAADETVVRVIEIHPIQEKRRPVEGVNVRIEKLDPKPDEDPLAEGRTDSEGAFTTPNLSPTKNPNLRKCCFVAEWRQPGGTVRYSKVEE